jgi:hypothetical protein
MILFPLGPRTDRFRDLPLCLGRISSKTSCIVELDTFMGTHK